MITTTEKIAAYWSGTVVGKLGGKLLVYSLENTKAIEAFTCDKSFKIVEPGVAIQTKEWLILSEEARTIFLRVKCEVESIIIEPLDESEINTLNIKWRLSFGEGRWRFTVKEDSEEKELRLEDVEWVTPRLYRYHGLLWYDRLRSESSSESSSARESLPRDEETEEVEDFGDAVPSPS